MEYQSLRGNAKGLYRDISEYNDIPSSWESMIGKNITNPLRYGYDGFPSHQVFMTVNQDERRFMLYRSCSRQQKNALSNSYYVHSYLKEFTLKDMLENFDSLLKISFFSEEQFDAAADNRPAGNPNAVWTSVDAPLDIPAEMLRAVLYGMVHRWNTGISKPVVVAVPRDENYDQYTYRAVKTIYGHLPAAIRALAGFMTYYEPDNKLTNIALYFLPEEYPYEDKIWLDGHKGNALGFLNCVLPEEAKRMIDRIVATSDPGVRDKFLNRLMVNVEDTVDSIMSLSTEQYTNYLDKSRLLDADIQKLEVFDQWVDFTNSMDEVSPKIREELIKALKVQITTDIFDLHFMNSLMETAQSIADYRSKLEKVSVMCSLSVTLDSHVAQKVKRDLEKKLNAVRTVDQILSLIRQVEGAENEPGVYPSDEVLASFRTECESKWGDLSRDEMYVISRNATQQLESARHAQMDVDALQKTCSEARMRMEDDLRAERLKLEQHDITTSIRDVKVREGEIVAEKLRNLAKSQLPLLGTSAQACEAEIKRLQSLKEKASGYKREYGYDLNSAFDTINRNLQEVEKKYTRNGGYHNAQMEELLAQNNYFGFMQKLLEIGQDELTETDKQRSHSKLVSLRPANIEKYLAAYRAHFGQSLTLKEVAQMDASLSSMLAKDLTQLSNAEVILNVHQKKLIDLYTELRLNEEKYHILLNAAPGQVSLIGGRRKLIFSASSLKGFLGGCLGERTNDTRISYNDCKNLVEYFIDESVIQEQDMPDVTKYLLANKLEELAYSILVDCCFGDQLMGAKNRYRLYDVLQCANALETFMTKLPEKYQCLRAELEWYRKGSGVKFDQGTSTRMGSGGRKGKKGEEKRRRKLRLPFLCLCLGVFVVLTAAGMALFMGCGDINEDTLTEPADSYSEEVTNSNETKDPTENTENKGDGFSEKDPVKPSLDGVFGHF